MAWEGISGWYLRVLRAGEITAGDEMRAVDPGSGVTVAEVMRVTYGSGRETWDIRLDADGRWRVYDAPASGPTDSRDACPAS